MKIHFDPSLPADERRITAAAVAPLHGTSYAGGIGGIDVTGNRELVTCKVCTRKLEAEVQ